MADFTFPKTSLPAFSTKGADIKAPPGIGSIPTRAGETPRKNLLLTRRFATSVSTKPVSSITPPIIGMIPTAKASRNTEGSKKVAIRLSKTDGVGRSRKPSTKPPENRAKARLTLEKTSIAARAATKLIHSNMNSIKKRR